MNKLLSFFQKYATPKNAIIVLVALQIVVQILHKFDQPILALTPGVEKLDLTFNYDVSTVARIFGAYGEQGRNLYAWDLLVDTLYPVFQSLSAILFILLVVRNPFWQKLFILFPVIFVPLDLIENLFLLSFLWSYPSLSTGLVQVANVITIIKLIAVYITTVEYFLFLLLAIILAIVSFVRSKLAARRAVG
jgi:hypothetical protein